MSSSEISAPREADPLFKDLNEKHKRFRQNVVYMSAELKEVRSRLTSQEQLTAKETLSRHKAEDKARDMEEEIHKLQKMLKETDEGLKATAATSEKNLKELEDLKSQLAATQATADATVASAQSAHLQRLALLKELDEKNRCLIEQEHHVNRLGEQLELLQKDLQARESSQKQLKFEVSRIEQDIIKAIMEARVDKDCELRKSLNEISQKNFKKINRLLVVKDEEIARLKDEIKILSAQWKLKVKDLESELEKQRRIDQELRKRVLKLEVSLQEARSKRQKLQRVGWQRDKALKELEDQVAAKQQNEAPRSWKQNIWESSAFRIVVPMSVLILLVYLKH